MFSCVYRIGNGLNAVGRPHVGESPHCRTIQPPAAMIKPAGPCQDLSLAALRLSLRCRGSRASAVFFYYCGSARLSHRPSMTYPSCSTHAHAAGAGPSAARAENPDAVGGRGIDRRGIEVNGEPPELIRRFDGREASFRAHQFIDNDAHGHAFLTGVITRSLLPSQPRGRT